MQKSIYLLHRPPDEERSIFASRLHEIGQKMLGLQPLGLRLNIHDSDAAPGASQEKCSSYGPFEAILQLWLSDMSKASRQPYEDLLAKSGGPFHGYLVAERLLVANLGNQQTPAFRNEGFSQMAVLQIPKRLDRETWLDRWQGRHTWVAISIHPHLEYIQNPVVKPVTEQAPPFDGFGEETFPMAGLTDERVLFKAIDDPEKFTARRKTMYEDAERFIDFDHLDMMITSQFDLRSPPR